MSLDKDGDGKITKDELPERMQRILERADINQDGAIDKDEAEQMAERFRRGGPGGPGRPNFVERIMRLDQDGDGKVTRDELPEPLRDRILQRADTNQDGAIDRDEAEQMAERFRPGGGPPPDAGPGPGDAPRVPGERP